MLNYTHAVTALMRDVVERVPALSSIDLSEVLVFARFGKSGASGPYATCHSLGLPVSEPRYFFWTDPRSGHVARRSEWFVTRSPEVRIDGRLVKYLISFALPRFCDQTLLRAAKHVRYRGEPWLAKLDTVVHELYHIDPTEGGIRVVNQCDAGVARAHSQEFYDHVADFVRTYLASDPDPAVYEFLTHDFEGLQRHYGQVTATTFRQFPSYPQRFHEPLGEQPAFSRHDASVPIVPLKEPRRAAVFTDEDVVQRIFSSRGARKWAMDHRDASPSAA